MAVNEACHFVSLVRDFVIAMIATGIRGCIGDMLLSYSNSFAQLFTIPSFKAYTFYNDLLTTHVIFLSLYLRAVSVSARYLGTAQRSEYREEVYPLAAFSGSLDSALNLPAP